MSSAYGSLENAIQDHLRAICESSGLPEGDASLEMLAEGWLEKNRAFSEQAAEMDMEIADKCDDASRGFLALTYSGSLVAVGPDSGGSRRAVYVSIDRRRDVPARAESDDAVLGNTAEVGRELIFEKGPVKQSSVVYRLAILPAALALPVQNERLNEATVALTREFQAVDETKIDME
ncbi:MAG: hypothetical protein CSA76_05420 [Spirochaetales bacterium]|nr:MAG: hypothetical protein CSA76_05420 [Spirochaetales bacterium]